MLQKQCVSFDRLGVPLEWFALMLEKDPYKTHHSHSLRWQWRMGRYGPRTSSGRIGTRPLPFWRIRRIRLPDAESPSDTPEPLPSRPMLSQLPGCADGEFYMFICAYCGFESPVGTWASRRREHEEHVKTCPKNPLRDAEWKIAALEEKLEESRRKIELLGTA